MSRTTKIWIAGFALLCLAVGGIVLRAILRRPAPAAAVEQMSAEEIAAWDALAGTSLQSSSGVTHRRMRKTSRDFFVGVQQRQPFWSRIQQAISGNPIKQQIREIQQEMDAPIREADFFDFPLEATPYLAKLQSLRKLSFTAGDLRGAPFAAVGQLAGLEQLSVTNSKLLPADLVQLRNLQHLAELDVMLTVHSETEKARLALLGALTAEERRQIDEYLAAHPKSSVKSIEAAILMDRAVRELGELKSLRVLKIGNASMTNVGLAAIARMPQLEEFELEVLDFGEESARLMASMNNLKRVHIRYVNDDILRELSKVSQLESLNVFAAQDVSALGIEGVLKMTKLHSLALGSLPLNDDQLAQFAALPELRLLDLRSRRVTVTPEGVARFQQLKPDCELLWRMDQEPRPQ